MATPRGIFEFKHFFPRELGTESGGTCSAAAVRALLKEMIAAENTHDPLSDVALAKMLSDQGVLVARRTVAKYRQHIKCSSEPAARGFKAVPSPRLKRGFIEESRETECSRDSFSYLDVSHAPHYIGGSSRNGVSQ